MNPCIIYALYHNKGKRMKIIISGIPIEDLDPKRLFIWLQSGIRKSILTLEWTAKKETPVNVGTLRNSFRSRFTELSGELTNTSLYAPFVHEWRKPGGRMPPLSAIDFWAKRKWIQIPTFILARSIARKGTKANPFMARTVEKEENNVEAIIRSELNKIYS